MIGLGVGVGVSRVRGLWRAIQAMFSQGEKGVWYDPSDLTSMFQDSAGTTAAVVGQPVGLVLDKSQGLVLGPELVTNGTFDANTTGWAYSGTGTVVLEGSSARVTAGATTAGGIVSVSDVPVELGKFYIVTADVSVSLTTGTLKIQLLGNSDSQTLSSSGTYAVRFIARITDSTTKFYGQFVGHAIGDNYLINNISVKELPGYHATQSTSTARPILRQSGSLYYLEFDGVDDFLVTPSIDFSGTDKMTVFAGVRKLSDAAQAMVCELSTNAGTLSGTFNLQAPNSTTNKYRAAFRGETLPVAYPDVTDAAFAAPVSSVLTAEGDIAADIQRLTVNGSHTVSSSADMGLGNFGNYALYIGMRAGTSKPFNGHLYSLVVRGALSDAAQIAAAESYVNSKTGAF